MEKNLCKLNCSYGKVSHTLKNYRNIYEKSSAKREYRDENVFKVDRALSKLITFLISNKKEFNHFFKSRSSNIVLLKLGNLHQNAKRYEARNTEREAREENLRAKRADFSLIISTFDLFNLSVFKFSVFFYQLNILKNFRLFTL